MLKITLLPFNVRAQDRMEDRFHSYGAPGESHICILRIQFKINSQVTMGIYPRIHISALAWDHVRKIPRAPAMSTVVPAMWPSYIPLKGVVEENMIWVAHCWCQRGTGDWQRVKEWSGFLKPVALSSLATVGYLVRVKVGENLPLLTSAVGTDWE